MLQQSLFGITDPTSGPDAQSALAFLEGAACQAQVTAAGEDVNAACSANDTALFTALAMLRHESETGGLAAYDGSSTQILDMENRFDITGEADDPLYTFAVRRPVNQEAAKIHGWELGGQYFFGDTGFGLQANYTIVRGDVGFDDNGSWRISLSTETEKRLAYANRHPELAFPHWREGRSSWRPFAARQGLPAACLGSLRMSPCAAARTLPSSSGTSRGTSTIRCGLEP